MVKQGGSPAARHGTIHAPLKKKKRKKKEKRKKKV